MTGDSELVDDPQASLIIVEYYVLETTEPLGRPVFLKVFNDFFASVGFDRSGDIWYGEVATPHVCVKTLGSVSRLFTASPRDQA